MVAIKKDVNGLVEHLTPTLGTTWHTACQPRPQNTSKLVEPAKSPSVWKTVEEIGKSRDFEARMKGHLDSKVTWM
eukprot:1713397-Pleurochrysis_carterae.AAC.1